MKLAVLQNAVYEDKDKTLQEVRDMVGEAARQGAGMAVLPEMFCCPYETEKFPLYAEEAGGKIWTALSDMAAQNGLFLVGGSMPELVRTCGEYNCSDRLYNTCFVFNDKGEQIARHRKVHLFDIDIKGGQYFKESDTFTPGDKHHVTVFEALGHKFGIAICFDIRFVEEFRQMALEGVEAVYVPGAFNMTTGPMHWELVFRSRAVDNQFFTIGAAPARDENSSYVSWANSIVCDPWGRVIAEAGVKPGITMCEIDFDEVKKVREQLPILAALKK